jgi:hypothetical protein
MTFNEEIFDEVINPLNLVFLPIQEASSDFAAMIFSSSSCGSKIALKPNIMPTLNDTVNNTIPPATN